MWIITGVLGLLGILIARSVVNKTYIALRLNPWALGAVDKWGFLLLGLVWLVFVIVCENYYREGIEGNVLWRRFGLITAAELFLLILIGLVPFLISRP